MDMKIQSALLSTMGALLFTFAGKYDTLKDIAKPYLGEYQCKIATLGNEDYLQQFRTLVLELKSENEYELRYHLQNGYKGKDTGKYAYDPAKQTVRLSKGEKGEWKRDIPLKNGTISLTIPLGEKLLYLQFEQK